MRGCLRWLFACLLVSLVADRLPSQDWPTYRHDNRRSGVTDCQLQFPLRELWTRHSTITPQMAWTGPAKWDAWAGNEGLQSMRNFDPCFYVTAVSGNVYFGSSVDDAVHCLDASNGKEKWVHFTGSAVRFPPTIADGLAYFGSDDGYVYACDAASGDLVWKIQAAVDGSRITSNRKLMSLYPVRTGVMIADDKAYFASSLLPWESSWLWCVNCKTGTLEQDSGFRTTLRGVTLQGALLASTERLYCPQGRAAPLAFERRSGKSLGPIGAAGGVFCVLTKDEMFLAGPEDQKSSDDQVRVADATSRQTLASFNAAHRVLVDGDHAWIPSEGQLKQLNRRVYIHAQQTIDQTHAAINRANKNDPPVPVLVEKLNAAQQLQQSAWGWSCPCPRPATLIKSGSTILVGSAGQVQAIDVASGNLLWQAPIDGVAHGLAVADGVLYVSSGLGHIYAFGSNR